MVPRIKEEEKDIQEEPLDIVEDPSTIEIVREGEKPETGTTRNGMNGSQLVQAEEEEDHRMSIVSIAPVVRHRADPEGRNLQDTTLKDSQK